MDDALARTSAARGQHFALTTARAFDHMTTASSSCEKGSYDNALSETINGLYKAEMIHRRGPWKTKESVELTILEWVSWFNHQRLLEPIEYIPPAEAEAEAEANYYRQLNESSMAA